MAPLEIRFTCALLLALFATACDSAPEPAPPPEPAKAPAVTGTATALATEAAAKPPAASLAPCNELCTRTASLNCGPVEACTAGCEQMAQFELCSKELSAMLECVNAQPATSFECDPQTRAPAIRDGYCDDQQNAVAQCVSKLQAKGAP